MASSPVDICNIALRLLSAAAITALDDGSDRASLCSTLYDPALDEVLRAHEWNCAQVRTGLAQDVTPPVFGWACAYTLPGDPYCLKVNETEPDDAEWVIEGRKLLTDETEMFIRYTARISNVAAFDAGLVKTLAAKLAFEMAWPVTKLAKQVEVAAKLYAVALADARSMDSQEGSMKTVDNSVLVDIRRQGFRQWSRNDNSV